jgi:hypothetical protein
MDNLKVRKEEGQSKNHNAEILKSNYLPVKEHTLEIIEPL